MNILQSINLVLLASLLFLFTACTSDENNSNQADSQNTNEIETPIITFINPLTGIFVDSPVEGLRYICSSGATGVTNTQGEFTCEAKDTVVFFLGTIPLAIVDMTETLTPLALFNGDEESALNFAQLLQTLDTDGNLSNGINIDEDLLATLDVPISFTNPNFDKDIQQQLNRSGLTLISEENATKHLNDTFISLDINNDGTYPRTYNWVASDWDRCSGPCGTNNGTQIREITCQDSIGDVVEETECDANTKPISSQSCTASSCSTTPTTPTPTPIPCQNVNPITGGCED